MKTLRAALTIFLLLAVITGLAYPALVTAIAQIAFPHQANGSVIVDKSGKAIGSELIGQFFDKPGYFWGRPSATAPAPYTSFDADKGTGSTGSNLGPTNPDQLKAVSVRLAALREAHPDQTGPVPVDLVTASASGLDPHISPAAAEYQVSRVAKERGLSPDRVRKLVAAHTEGRTFGVLGEPRVNVLRLNLALDAESREK